VNSRTIVTSHPDVACDVCERRLLRGEHAEVFLAAGQPRSVCELCAPRAAHQGWKRVSDLDAAAVTVARPRRARGIFERFRSAGRAPWADPEQAETDDLLHAGAAALDPVYRRAADEQSDFGSRDLAAEVDAALGDAPPVVAASPLARALDIFNATEYPRRIGGVARSLGPPEVSVRELDVAGLISIVVAWELCWYRYRVDIDDPDAGAQLVAQGTELSELEREERVVNAAAADRGALRLNAEE
jgi:hypothetical protein